MFKENFLKENFAVGDRKAIKVTDVSSYSLDDTFLCGQCFRYEEINRENDYVEYFTVVGEKIIFVGQEKKGELFFYDADENLFESVIRPYFDLDTDYEKIKIELTENFDTPFFKNAAELSSGIRILRQDPWEAICSFIISQNNNIPRIRKIIRELSSAYGVNLALQNGLKSVQ